MKTKVILTIDGIEHTLNSDSLRNWDEVLCTYKRTEFSGVVRSFSSKFEFANDAYDMLLAAYLRDGVRASATVALYVLNNDWSWSKEFEAPLNFSTATWNCYIFSINSLDNGLAALIKSRKSTKYEFVVGDNIEVGGILNYDRLTMQNSCAHEIMGEDSADNGAVLIGNANSSTRLPTYSLNSEVFENSPILFEDQTTDVGSAFISAVHNVPNMKLRIEIWSYETGNFWGTAESVEIHLMKFTGADTGMTDLGTVYQYVGEKLKETSFGSVWGMAPKTCVGTFKSLDALKRAYPNPPQNVWAIINPGTKLDDAEAVYITPVSNKINLVQWEQGHMLKSFRRGGPVTAINCIDVKYIMEFDYPNLSSGNKFALFYTAKIHSYGSGRDIYFPIFSKITTRWESKAKVIDIDSIRPVGLLSALMEKIGDGRFNIIPQFSDYDPRIAKTYLLAAESVRDIAGAKIYSSFNDFCDWMETVFGYVYTLGEPVAAQYNGVLEMSGIEDDWAFDVGDIHGRVVDGYCPDGYYGEAPFFIRSHNCFCVWDNHETGNVYTRWKDSYKYNDENGKGRKDIIFDSLSHYYVMGENDDLVEFTGDVKSASRITQPIYFMHRSELFQNVEQGIVFTESNELQSKINSSMLYSIVEVGYEKQDYETECGRDEWNFMNYYNTGIDVIEKKLTLQSKYRADCYGLEFLSQERAKDSTDNKSDNTVFFVYCKMVVEEESGTITSSRGDSEEEISRETQKLVIDRTARIEGALSDSVFNGEFSPYYCLKANEGYISAMAPNITLQFASSDGNSDIVIDGVKTTANIALTQRLFSESELEFISTDLEQSVDFSKLIKVVKNGLVYSGFLKETECCFARPSEVKYTLIVKDIQTI